jgi:ribonuclease HI
MAIRAAAYAIPSRLDVLCVADSQYAIQCLTRGRGGFLSGWEVNGKLAQNLVANADLIKETLAIIDNRQGGWVFEWVKGHRGHPLNSEADRLANTAAGFSVITPAIYGPGWSMSKKRASHR